MAFADMFAPMRNFGATAAATTQAEAARMGAQASMRRARTAERLAPWQMGATAAQGIGTIGGLAQKFMEMEQMRPQREAMTGYYEAMTREKDDPLRKIGLRLELEGKYRLAAARHTALGEMPPIQQWQDDIRRAAGARKVPSALPAGQFGPMLPTAWDYGDTDPGTRSIYESFAEGLPAYLALPDAEVLADKKKLLASIQAGKIFDQQAILDTQKNIGPELAAQMNTVNALQATMEHLIKGPTPADSPLMLGLMTKMEEAVSRLPPSKVPAQVTEWINNIKARRAKLWGTGSLYAPTTAELQDSRALQINRNMTPGLSVAENAALNKQALQPGATREATDVMGIRDLLVNNIEAAGGLADETRATQVEDYWAENNLVYSGKGSKDEQQIQMSKIRGKSDSSGPSTPGLLAKELVLLANGKVTHGPESNGMVQDMLRMRLGYVDPEMARAMWNDQVNKAIRHAGIDLTDKAAVAKFRKKIYKGLGKMSSWYENETPGAMIGDIRGGTAGSIAGHGGGKGASKEELTTIARLIREPYSGVAREVERDFLSPAEIEAAEVRGDEARLSAAGGLTESQYADKRRGEGASEADIQSELDKIGGQISAAEGDLKGVKRQVALAAESLTPADLASILKVGSPTGLTFADTVYATTDMAIWEIDENLWSVIDEYRMGDNFWGTEDVLAPGWTVSQGAEELASQIGPLGVAKWAGKAAQGGTKLFQGARNLFAGSRAAAPVISQAEAAARIAQAGGGARGAATALPSAESLLGKAYGAGRSTFKELLFSLGAKGGPGAARTAESIGRPGAVVDPIAEAYHALTGVAKGAKYAPEVPLEASRLYNLLRRGGRGVERLGRSVRDLNVNRPLQGEAVDALLKMYTGEELLRRPTRPLFYGE